jgi:hypothetical protein
MQPTKVRLRLLKQTWRSRMLLAVEHRIDKAGNSVAAFEELLQCFSDTGRHREI